MSLTIYQLDSTSYDVRVSGYNTLGKQLDIAERNMNNIYNILKEHAEGRFFDTVNIIQSEYVPGVTIPNTNIPLTIEYIKGSSEASQCITNANGTYSIECKNGDDLVLQIFYDYTDRTSWNPSMEHKTGILYRNYYHNGYLSQDHYGSDSNTNGYTHKRRQHVNKIAVTSSAILISFGSTNYKNTGALDSSIYTRYDLIIGKTDKGATVIITPFENVYNSTISSTTSDGSLMVTCYDTLTSAIYSNIKYNSETYHANTIMANIPVSRENIDDDVIKDIVYVPFTQWKYNDRTSYSLLRINNVEYFYTGWLAVKV
jgi:hypothetical protein